MGCTTKLHDFLIHLAASGDISEAEVLDLLAYREAHRMIATEAY